MDVLLLVGRILYGLIFVGAGIGGHLLSTDETAAYAQMRGVKNARILVIISGVGISAGGLGIIFGFWADLAVLGVVAYCLIAAFMVHHFWTDEGQIQTIEMSMFMKNLSMAGGGLILFVLIAKLGAEVPFTLTDPLFNF